VMWLCVQINSLIDLTLKIPPFDFRRGDHISALKQLFHGKHEHEIASFYGMLLFQLTEHVRNFRNFLVLGGNHQ
jgi:hypothetical protein